MIFFYFTNFIYTLIRYFVKQYMFGRNLDIILIRMQYDYLISQISGCDRVKPSRDVQFISKMYTYNL